MKKRTIIDPEYEDELNSSFYIRESLSAPLDSAASRPQTTTNMVEAGTSMSRPSSHRAYDVFRPPGFQRNVESKFGIYPILLKAIGLKHA